MGNIEMPKQVKDAALQADHDALVAMGTEGGIRSGLIRADREAQKAKDFAAHEAAQEALYHVSPEGDILPPDPKIVETL